MISNMLRLDPPLPVLIRLGDQWVKAMAHIVIDYGFDHDLIWTCFLDESRECWSAPNANIRAQDNVTAGRPKQDNP